MHTPTLLSLLMTGTSLALALPRPHLLRPRQSNCNYHPNQTKPVEYSTPAYILRIESQTTNTTLGYLDAFSSSYAQILPSKSSASQAFNAPDYDSNEALIFWNGNQTEERGLTLNQGVEGAEIGPVTTGGCGTRTESLEGKYEDRGTCGMAGQRVTSELDCPSPGTTNDAGQECVPQAFFGECGAVFRCVSIRH